MPSCVKAWKPSPSERRVTQPILPQRTGLGLPRLPFVQHCSQCSRGTCDSKPSQHSGRHLGQVPTSSPWQSHTLFSRLLVQSSIAGIAKPHRPSSLLLLWPLHHLLGPARNGYSDRPCNPTGAALTRCMHHLCTSPNSPPLNPYV